MGALDLSGPQFLLLYAGLLAAAVGVSLVVRLLIAWTSAPETLPQLHPYEIALMAGGEKLAALAALSVLIHRGVVEPDVSTRALMLRGPHHSEHPFEREVARCVLPGRKALDVWAEATDIAEKLRPRVAAYGLVP